LESKIDQILEKETLSEANIVNIKKDLEEIENTFLTNEEYNNLKSEFTLLTILASERVSFSKI
jgi:hypothetical protein